MVPKETFGRNRHPVRRFSCPSRIYRVLSSNSAPIVSQIEFRTTGNYTMFRRIELIHELPVFKAGLMIASYVGVARAWAHMKSPRRLLFKNCRFYFTEDGWKRYGRATVTACQKTGQRYRVISIKERSIDIVYRDEYQVAVRPRKNRSVRGQL